MSGLISINLIISSPTQIGRVGIANVIVNLTRLSSIDTRDKATAGLGPEFDRKFE